MDFSFHNNSPIKFICGPCVIESRDMAMEVAETLYRVRQSIDVGIVFKGSFEKDNRTSALSFRGIGRSEAVSILGDIKEKYGFPTTTDVHSVEDVAYVDDSDAVDIIQIPAFLSRQTSIIQAAAGTEKVVNIKKGQFLSALQAKAAYYKSAGSLGRCNDTLITERGTFFGYGDYVVDMRSMFMLRRLGIPVVFDMSHSIQQPGDTCSAKGDIKAGAALARAAIALEIAGIFFECHPNPRQARSDPGTQWPLNKIARLIAMLHDADRAMKAQSFGPLTCKIGDRTYTPGDTEYINRLKLD